MRSTTDPTSYNEITLRDVGIIIWRSRFWLAVFLIIGTAAGVAWGLWRPKEYEAVIVVAPVTDQSGSSRLGALGALASQYSGLASLAGVSLSDSNERDQTIAVMQSEFLTERYIRERNLLPILFPHDWDARSGHWKRGDKDHIPTLWKANRYFKKVRNVTDERRTGLVYLKITWKDPNIAAAWANDLVQLTNSYLRDKAIQESERHIAYLTEQATKTEAVEAKRAIYALMQDEINKAMVARGREEYVLKIIDPAVPPERPSSSGPLGMATLGFSGGLVAFVLWIFARRAFFRPV